MSNCIEEYKGTVIGTSIGFGVSLLINIYLALNLYCTRGRENKKLQEIELIVMEENKKKEEVVLRIGNARTPITRSNNLPEWVLEDYNNLRIPTTVTPKGTLLAEKSGSI